MTAFIIILTVGYAVFNIFLVCALCRAAALGDKQISRLGRGPAGGARPFGSATPISTVEPSRPYDQENEQDDPEWFMADLFGRTVR